MTTLTLDSVDMKQLLSNLRPSTIAALLVDLDEAGAYSLIQLRDELTEQLVALVGDEDEFTAEMKAAAK